MKTVTSTVYTSKLLTDAHTHTRTQARIYGRRTSHGHISSPCHFVTGELKSLLHAWTHDGNHAMTLTLPAFGQ
ncbi:hypothetical protein DPMN_181936 [Dreissena polymorpha]|uniref:Uncharacterized protein n=1 Tax=Dreissena polymorpha TaxID=45954 RepID=A0A9D4DDS8_DREPO|nr:hypothetical protein DPMN_181936 [Dreissena polymorpha]